MFQPTATPSSSSTAWPSRPLNTEQEPSQQETNEEHGEATMRDVGEGADMDTDFLQSDDIAIFILDQLAGDKRAYGREKRAAGRRIISEIYSPPRVTKLLSRLPNSVLFPALRWT